VILVKGLAHRCFVGERAELRVTEKEHKRTLRRLNHAF
jgi:hypothetical protein